MRTNARSFEERRYSQLSSQTTIATTTATPMSGEDELSELGSGHDAFSFCLIPMRLNLRVVSVRAISVGRRSMLEAP